MSHGDSIDGLKITHKRQSPRTHDGVLFFLEYRISVEAVSSVAGDERTTMTLAKVMRAAMLCPPTERLMTLILDFSFEVQNWHQHFSEC